MPEAEKKTIGNGRPGPGRPKGVPNKLTGEVKTMILEALESAGGVEYLTERAQDPRTASAFLTLVGKVLPLQVTGAEGGAIQQALTVQFIKAKEADDNSAVS
jgi:hypothetical protein